MDKRVFQSFQEASSYARTQAVQAGITLRLERNEDKFVVISQADGMSRSGAVDDLEHKKSDIVNTLMAGLLSYEQITAVLDNQNKYGFSKEELDLLKSKLKQAIDEKTAQQKNQLSYCCQCGMVGDNCTCRRSWF